MALVLKDRVKVTSGSTGTGTFTLGAPVLGFQDFAAIGDGNTTYYTIALQSGSEWEVGIGTVTDTAGTFTLSRDMVLESSNANAAVNFSAGTKDVFVTYPAERAVYLNSAGTEVTQEDFDDITANNISLTTGSITTAPVAATDIPNKLYVDEVAEGLKAKPAAELATTASLDATYNNGTAGVGATLTANSNGAFPTIDGVTLASTALGVNGVLVKNQTNSAHNGRYNLTTVGDGSTPWVLTRCPLCDEASEIPGAYVFVKAGTLNGNTGWVQTVLDPSTFVVGTDAIIVVQFFGAGTYTAGTGLTLTGTEFSITNVGTAGTYGTASQVPVFTTNAQGQVTAATPTAIAIAAAAVSGLAASATTDTTNASNITAGTLPVARLNGSYTGITGVGTLTAGTWNATTIAPNHGGTGLTSYTVGDIIFADGTTSLSRLADVATGNALISGGVGTAPFYGKIGLTTHVSGTLPIGNGGTGQTTAAAAINALLPSQTSQSGNYLTTNGTNPSWVSIPAPNNGTLTMNVSGTGLSGSATFTANQAGGSTFTVTSNATNANTNSTIVARDASGNFSAGTITAALSGNASTATILQTTRTINGTNFNGSANITTANWGTARTLNGVSVNGSADVNIPNILATNSTTAFATTGVTSAVNHLATTNAATGGAVSLTTAGSDANIGLNITTKGTGAIVLDTGAGTGQIDLKPGASNARLWDDGSSHYYQFVTGDRTANYSITLPAGNVTLTAGTSVVTTRTLTAGDGLTGGGNLSANRTFAVDSTVVRLDDTQTLTNKTVTDNSFTIQDDLDNTKKAQFQLSNITAGNTRVYTFPNATSTLATISNVTQTFAGTTTFSGGTVTVGSATGNSTYGLGTGATTGVSTKNVNIGINGVSGSTTLVTVGSAVSGANSRTSVNGNLIANSGLFEHTATINRNYEIQSGNNAMSAGPVVIDSGVSVTVPSGSRWVVI